MSERPVSERSLVTAVTVPPALLRQWDAYAQRHGLNRSELVRRATSEYLARQEARDTPVHQST